MILNFFDTIIWHIRDPRADSSRRTNIDVVKPHTQSGHNLELRSRCNGTGRHGSPAGQDGIWIMLCHQAIDFFFAPGNGGTCNELEACRFNYAGFDLQVGPRIIRSEEHTSELQSLMALSYA